MIKIMGRNFVYSIINFLATFTLCCLVSCNEYVPFDEHDFAKLQYEEDFVKTFGKPMPNHNWGFVDQPVVSFGSETRNVYTNRNQWYDNYHEYLDIPGYPDHLHGRFYGDNGKDKANPGDAGSPCGDVTEEEIEYVRKWFSEHKNPTSTAIHWESFFVQFVDCWSDSHEDKRNMDQLGCRYLDGTWEHINNFNANTRAIQYVTGAGTEAWTYRSSFDNKFHDNLFNIQHLVFDIIPTNCPHNCSVHHYDGWYVGLDYEAYVFEGDGSLRKGSVYADGYFNDWIVKVSPGNLVGTPATVRVMCEDLGGASDWDFNDVVFDVSFRNYHGKVYACIALQAAGGTLPITVGTQDANYEVHKLLGDGTLTPIIHPATYAYYEIEYLGSFSESNSANASSIPIYVNNSMYEVGYYTIINSDVAQKFACPDDVQWTEEREFILDRYPNLTEWIQNGGTARWGDTSGGNNNQNVVIPQEPSEPTTPTEPSEGGNEQVNNPVAGVEGVQVATVPNADGNFAFDIDKSAFANATSKITFTFVKNNNVPMNGAITYRGDYAEIAQLNYTESTMIVLTITDVSVIEKIKSKGVSYRNYASTDPTVFVSCE